MCTQPSATNVCILATINIYCKIRNYQLSGGEIPAIYTKLKKVVGKRM